MSEETNTPREQQFAGFAKLLLARMMEEDISIETIRDDWREVWERIIARGAYDLAKHTVLSIGPAELDMLTTDECVQRIPDLTKLQEEKDEE